VTGFILEGFDDVVTSGDACPSAWPTTVSVTPNEDAGTVVGLFAHFDDQTVQLDWPEEA
jgi:hypothetical protein